MVRCWFRRPTANLCHSAMKLHAAVICVIIPLATSSRIRGNFIPGIELGTEPGLVSSNKGNPALA